MCQNPKADGFVNADLETILGLQMISANFA